MNNTQKRAKIVKDIVAAHYEEGRQDRCKLWVYRNIVNRDYPMCDRTFWRYLGMETDEKKENEEDQRQLKMF
ncbi:MAG: hypothetical protein LBT04_09950 [Prevotellaceae bacterium]|jgi:hypothetical protein|nr:hypothetical protein [Prevotellaceae bacterium]